MKRRRTAAAGLLIGLLVGLLGIAGCRNTATSEGSIPTATAEQTERFVREIRAEGTLQAVQATSVSPPPGTRRPMRIGWMADDGARVEEGDVIVRLDATDLQRELADSKDDIRSNDRRIDKVDVERSANRSARDATVALSELEMKTAREFKSDDIDIFSRIEIAQSEIDIELSEARASHARTVKGIEGKVSASQLQLHRIAKDQARRQVERAQEALAKLEVRAPHAGVLVLHRNWKGDTAKVGDTVWPGQKLAELPLVAELEAKLFVLEADAGALAEGVPADVYVASKPTQRHGGSIKRVDTLAQPRHPDVPINYFGVTVALERTDPQSMRVGQRVEAKLRVEASDAIVVPRQSVFEREGRRVVFRKSGTGFDEVEVELGAASAGRVVITSGLEAGDEVALRDPAKNAGELLSVPDPLGDSPPAEAKTP